MYAPLYGAFMLHSGWTVKPVKNFFNGDKAPLIITDHKKQNQILNRKTFSTIYKFRDDVKHQGPVSFKLEEMKVSK